MVIFHSYVSLPEGTPILGNSQMVSGHGWMNGVTFFSLWMKSWSVFGHANG
jgi:hypothetical protein